jgi:hypothetical protein
MIVRIIASLLLTVWVAAPAAQAQLKPSAPAAVPRSASDNDRAIVDIVIPQDTFFAGNLQTFSDGLRAMIAKDSASSAMVEQNPGLQDAMLKAGQAATLAMLTNEFPPLREKMAGAVAQSLQPADYAPTLLSLRSTAATKLRAGSYGKGSRAMLVGRAQANGTGQLTEKDNASLRARAATEGLKALTPQEIRLASAFAVTPAGQRYARANKALNAIALEWANGLHEKSAPVLEAMRLAAQRYFKDKK